MGYLITVVVLALLGLAFTIGRRKRGNCKPLPADKASALTPVGQLARLKQCGKFNGVSVESHCPATSSLVGVRFTFENAPELPLPGCDATPCRCRFVGITERRQLIDRRSGHDRRESLRMDSDDRRSDQPRRKSERDAWGAFRRDR